MTLISPISIMNSICRLEEKLIETEDETSQSILLLIC